MRKLLLILGFILPMLLSGQHHMMHVLARQSTVFTGWTTSSLIVTGLGDIGSQSCPTVFQLNGTTYMISGNSTGTFNGYSWDGSTWVSSSSIISGLADAGSNSTPSVFWYNSTMYIIIGRTTSNTCVGYSWNGSTWVSNTGIVSGLNTSGTGNRPHIFYYLDNSVEPMDMLGRSNGTVFGEYYSGSTWVDEPGIFTSTTDVGDYASPCYFYHGINEFYLVGNALGTFNGYTYDYQTSTMTVSSLPINGLPDVGTYSAPYAFYIGNILYLLVGSAAGTFTGYVAS